jgi:hypothetical protein
LLQKPVVLRPLKLVLDEAGVDKADKLEAEIFPVFPRVQTGRITVDNLLKLLEHRVPLRIRETAGGHLDQCDPEGPNVRPDVNVLKLVFLVTDAPAK